MSIGEITLFLSFTSMVVGLVSIIYTIVYKEYKNIIIGLGIVAISFVAFLISLIKALATFCLNNY